MRRKTYVAAFVATSAAIATAGLVIALLLIAEASAANPADKQLAKRLVATKGDVPSEMSDTGRGLRLGRCLPRTGFTVTARATGPHWGTPHSGVDSVAAVLRTKAGAKSYYRATVRAMSACLARQLRRVKKPPTIGSPQRLHLPRFGDRSTARRMTVAYPPGTDSIVKYTLDWVVVRENRAVLVDAFSLYVGWGNGGTRTVAEAEQATVSRELIRAFGR